MCDYEPPWQTSPRTQIYFIFVFKWEHSLRHFEGFCNPDTFPKTLELNTNGPSGYPFFADTFYNTSSDSPTMITSFFSLPFHLKWSSTVKRGKTLVDTRTSNTLPINEPAHLLRSGPLIRILVSQMLPWKNLALQRVFFPNNSRRLTLNFAWKTILLSINHWMNPVRIGCD